MEEEMLALKKKTKLGKWLNHQREKNQFDVNGRSLLNIELTRH